MSNKVAVVTGASRGLGRGMARALGSKGMTVYVTGRSALDGVVEEINKQGGVGVAFQCDHGDDQQVAEFFKKIEREEGRLDLHINNAAAVYRDELTKKAPFWEKDSSLVDMITIGLRSDYIAAYYATPLLIKTGHSLMAHISFYGAVAHFMGPAYGAAKAGTDKMSFDMADELRDHDVASVSIWPGYVRTDESKKIPDELFSEDIRKILPEFESPEFTGLVIASLLEDPERMHFSGKTLIGAHLGLRYGIKDLDGKQPRDWTEIMGKPQDFFSPG